MHQKYVNYMFFPTFFIADSNTTTVASLFYLYTSPTFLFKRDD